MDSTLRLYLFFNSLNNKQTSTSYQHFTKTKKQSLKKLNISKFLSS